MRYTGLKENSTEIMERDKALISCRACLFFIVFWWQKKNIVFKISTCCQPLIIELRKRYTLRLFRMCLEERGFGSCSVCTNGSLGGKVCMGRARGWKKLSKLTKNELHQKQFLKILPTLHVRLPLVVSEHYILNCTAKNAYFWIYLQNLS